MGRIRVACSTITYGKFRSAEPGAYPEERLLAEIAEAGYEGCTSGPRQDRTPGETTALYAQYGLTPVSGYLGADWWKPERRADIVAQAERLGAFHEAIGCGELYVAAGGFDYVSRANGRTRSQLAGHVGPDDGLTDEEFERFAALLDEVGALTLTLGVKSCFHNHVGSVIETRAELDRIMALTDPGKVFGGFDTGHLAWAGEDVVAVIVDYAARIKTLHLKDVNPAVQARSRAEEWDYGTFCAHGGWVELGDGMIDFPAVFAELEAADYDGWVIVEIDETPRASALESFKVSRQYLASIGL